MEKLIQVLVYIHAFFGGIGLITGICNIIFKKGSKLHKRLGLVFSGSMLISAAISLFVSRMPNHENLFLFLIGVFTIYLVLAGNRALTFKNKMKMSADLVDKSISGIMWITSLVMIVIGVMGTIKHSNNGILFLVFGAFGFLMSSKDFKTFKEFKEKKNAWLISHLGRMIAALIASITAFIVAGLHIGTLIAWITPSILGTAYIIYWGKKLRSKQDEKEMFA